MTRFRWFGFAAVVVCASVFLMGCGDSSAPAYDTAPATIDESNTDTCPARPAPGSWCETLDSLPPPPASGGQDAPSLPEDYREYTPGDYEPEEKPCGAGGPAEVC